ncbi:MAG: tetratricopeptide repeat protein [Clostridiales bacterium]|nr:tetratricopeptide repeat protein [Clostridiales bacterium]
MSLWLCRQEQVKRPYYMEVLRVHLYSSQELSYVIFNHPLLVMDDFVNEELLAFLRDELNMGFLALKLERWLKSAENPDETLVLILQECDYYSAADITRYRQLLQSLRKKHPAEYGKMKADELFSLRRYEKAAGMYRQLLLSPRDDYVNEAFVGRLWNNFGSCCARMGRIEQALAAYEKAWELAKNPRMLEQMYELTRLDERLKLSAPIAATISDEQREEWDAAIEKAKQEAAESAAVLQIDELFARDPIRRQQGAAKLLQQWKQEYRSMA